MDCDGWRAEKEPAAGSVSEPIAFAVFPRLYAVKDFTPREELQGEHPALFSLAPRTEHRAAGSLKTAAASQRRPYAPRTCLSPTDRTSSLQSLSVQCGIFKNTYFY